MIQEFVYIYFKYIIDLMFKGTRKYLNKISQKKRKEQFPSFFSLFIVKRNVFFSFFVVVVFYFI